MLIEGTFNRPRPAQPERVVPDGVQNGYVSSGTSGHTRPLPELKNRPVSSEKFARACPRVLYSSFPCNEGVPGSSPGVGFNYERDCA